MTDTDGKRDDDLLVGQDAIGKAFGLTTRQVETLRRKSPDAPIWYQPGLGVCAKRQMLDDYFKRQAQKAKA